MLRLLLLYIYRYFFRSFIIYGAYKHQLGRQLVSWLKVSKDISGGKVFDHFVTKQVNFVRMNINRLKKILLLMWCNVVWDLAVQVFGEQERMALLHCLAVVISSLLVV